MAVNVWNRNDWGKFRVHRTYKFIIGKTERKLNIIIFIVFFGKYKKRHQKIKEGIEEIRESEGRGLWRGWVLTVNAPW